MLAPFFTLSETETTRSEITKLNFQTIESSTGLRQSDELIFVEVLVLQ